MNHSKSTNERNKILTNSSDSNLNSIRSDHTTKIASFHFQSTNVTMKISSLLLLRILDFRQRNDRIDICSIEMIIVIRYSKENLIMLHRFVVMAILMLMFCFNHTCSLFFFFFQLGLSSSSHWNLFQDSFGTLSLGIIFIHCKYTIIVLCRMTMESRSFHSTGIHGPLILLRFPRCFFFRFKW